MDDADPQQAGREDLQGEPRVDAAHGAPSGGCRASSSGMTGLLRRGRALDAAVRLLAGAGSDASTSCGGSPVKYRQAVG